MNGGRSLIPVIFLISGVILTTVGLAGIVARGPMASPVFLVIMLVGLIDGLTGLIWTSGVLFGGRRNESTGTKPAPPPRPGDEAAAREERLKQTLVLASGLLSVIFLGALLAAVLYLHVIVACLRNWRVF